MKALRPPPIMPTRSRRPFRPSTAVAWTIVSASNAEQFEVGRAIGPGGREIVKDAISHFDDMIGDELSALARGDFGMLQTAFPFVHRPSREIVGGELGKDRFEINLAVAKRPVAPGALKPALIAAIDALLRGWVELGVLDVEHLDTIVIGVDEAEIVHALLNEVARVVIDVAALVAADRVEKHVERIAVEDVFARVNFEAEIDAILVINVEDGFPAAALLGETFLDQSGRPLRIGIEIGPGERPGKAHMLGQSEAARNAGRLAHLIGRPMAPLLRVAAHRRRALSVEQGVIGRMNGHYLSLKMSRKLADCDAYVSERSLDLIAIGFALVGAVEIEESIVPGRDLDGFVTVGFRPSRNAGERIVRRRIACELSKKQARALDGSHRALSLNGLSFRRLPRWGNILPYIDTCKNLPIVNSGQGPRRSRV